MELFIGGWERLNKQVFMFQATDQNVWTTNQHVLPDGITMVEFTRTIKYKTTRIERIVFDK